MQSQINPDLAAETSGEKEGLVLVDNLREQLIVARDESSQHGTNIEALQEATGVIAESVQSLAGSTSLALSEKLDQSAADDFATSEQGDKADSAVQPSALSDAIATRATSAQGDKADTAVQPEDLAAAIATRATTAQGDKADSAAQFTVPQKAVSDKPVAVKNRKLIGENGEVLPAGQVKKFTRKWGVIADSKNRRAITPNAPVTTIDSYSMFSHAQAFSMGKIQLHFIAGNQGFDINETLAILKTKPPCNAVTSFGVGAETEWGIKDIDLNELDGLILDLAFNHMTAFNFTSPDLATREITNLPLRVAIEGWARALLDNFLNIPKIRWITQGPVGPNEENWNGGDIMERGYIWTLKWINSMLLSLCKDYPNLRLVDITSIMIDQENLQYIAKPYFTLTADGTQALQDPHPSFHAYRLIGKQFWEEEKADYINAPVGFPIARSDKKSISQDSNNIYPDSLFYGNAPRARVNTRLLTGAGNGSTVPVEGGAYVSGLMPPQMAVQVNNGLEGGNTVGQVTVRTDFIPCPSGSGMAVQADITANVAFDGSMGVSCYELGVLINAAIDAGLITFNENKVIQTCAYAKFGLAGANDGEVINVSALRSYGASLRCRTVAGVFSTATEMGAANSNSDHSIKLTGLQLAGQFEGRLSSPAMRIEGITPATPNRMRTRTMAAPTTDEYWYFFVAAKVNAGQKFRFIIGNFGLYIAPLRADGLIPDIIV